MAKLVFGVWTADSGKLKNESVAARIGTLDNRIRQVVQHSTPSFIVFVAAEFLFMHGDAADDCVRWYTRKERDAALSGLAASSRLFARLLLIPGTICWAKKSSPALQKTEWLVRNEAPVFYGGQRLILYGKRNPAGERISGDALRLYKSRRGDIDLELWKPDYDSSGQKKYVKTQATGDIAALEGQAAATVARGAGGARMPAAPGIKAATDRYADRIRFDSGTTEPSFDVPGGTFTGGVEICADHTQHTLQSISSRGPTNFHVLTSNKTTYIQGHENLSDPGYFVHCDAENDKPTLVTLSGGTKSKLPASDWQKLSDDMYIAQVAMPKGL